MMLSPRVCVFFIVLIDLYIFLCQEISSASLVNNSFSSNGEQGNNEKDTDAFWKISDKTYNLSGMKTSSSVISDNHSVNKAKIGNRQLEIENT